MHFKILGSGPGIPELDKNLASIYVQTEHYRLLLDCGEGSSKKLLQLGLSGDHLDAILITHYHPDHISGVFMLLQMLYLQNRTKPLCIYVPERPSFILDMMHAMYTFERKFGFELQIKLITEVEHDLIGIKVASTDHLLSYRPQIEALQLDNEMASWAIRLAGERGDLVYSADLSTTDCIAEFLQGAHSVIVDALHPEAQQILQLQGFDLQRVILNHGISAELEAHLEQHPVSSFEFAQEDHDYQI